MWRGVLSEGGCGVQSSEFIRAGRGISYLGVASYLMGLLISSHASSSFQECPEHPTQRRYPRGGGQEHPSTGPSTGRIYIPGLGALFALWGDLSAVARGILSRSRLDRAQGVRTWPVLRGHLSQWATRSILSHRAAYLRGACPEAINPRGRLLAHALPTSWRVGLWLTASDRLGDYLVRWSASRSKVE